MFNYILSWYDGHEESESIVLLHEKKFSQKEFNDLIVSLIPDIFEEYGKNQILNQEFYNKKYPDDTYEINKDEIYESITPNLFYWEVIKKLTEEHGFFDNDYTAYFSMVGYRWEDYDCNVDIETPLKEKGFYLYEDPIEHNFSDKVWKKINAD